jgi:hypothetical protein
VKKIVNANTNGLDKRPEAINKNGRPKLFVSTIISELTAQGIENVKPSQVIDIYEKLINLTIVQLSELANNNDAAWLIRQTAKQMLKNPEKAMQEILDRAHGKSKQQMDVTSNGENIKPTIVISNAKDITTINDFLNKE